MEKKIIKTQGAPAPIGPYNQAVQFGNMLFVSGQIAIDPKDGNLFVGNIDIETKIVMENISAILKEAGMDFSNVLKSTIFLMDMSKFSIINDEYSKYFTDNYPARETVQVAGLPKGVQVEISVIAAR